LSAEITSDWQTMSTDERNPYAPSQHAGPTPHNSAGKIVAVICLVVAAVLSVPIAFFVSCLGGLATVGTMTNGPGADGLFAFVGFGCGFVGVGLTIWGFAKLIMMVMKSGSSGMPYEKPKDFANAPPFAPPGDNPFVDRGA
jgi:hypothetical protein